MMKFLRTQMRVVVAVLVLVVGGVIYARFGIKKSIVPVYTHPEYRTLEKVFEVSGSVDAREKASLRFLAGGKLVYLGAKEGDTVKKWQTLASIDKRELQKNLEKDLNSYSIQRWTNDQNKENRKDAHGNKATDRANDQDQFTLNNTVLTVELKDLAIKNASLYAPFDGVLVSAPTEVVGTILSATDTFTVVNPNTMIFSAEVDESDIGLVHEGQKATVKLDAYSQDPIETAVDRIAYKSSETSTGTVFPVQFSLPFSSGTRPYRLGMNGNVKILIDKKDHVLSVPMQSLVERDGKMYVTVKTGEKTTEQRMVVIGLENDDYAEIADGIRESDSILVR